MATAQVSDVVARMGPLTPEQTTLATTLLGDAEVRLASRVPDLLAKVAADPEFAKAVIQVESWMVVRVLRNPDGYRQESEDGYSYSFDTRAAAGFLTVLREEWEMLGVTDGPFSIAPYLQVPPAWPVDALDWS